MRQVSTILFGIALAAGCVDGNVNADRPDAGSDVELTEGGSLMLEHCGYEVVTRSGATAPVLAESVLGDNPTPRQIHLGIAGDASTSAVILWRTDDEGSANPTLATTVEYGTGGNLDQSQTGVTYYYISGFNQNGETVRIHETHLCGLTPDTEYSYRVGGAAGTSEAWSDTFTFRTAPAPDATDAEVVFAVVGDSRDGYDIWGQMAGEIASHSPDAILFSGDAVTIGQVQLEWESFFDAAKDLLASTPILSAHGNHDLNSINFYSLFAMPGDEENFGLRYGPAHLVFLNDSPVDEGDINGKSADLLDAEMGATDAPWKFLIHHRPLWSASTRHGSNMFLQQAWGPIIDEHRVDMVFAGHDHNYERSYPLDDGARVANDDPALGTTYVISGGAGASLYENGSDFWTAVSHKEYGFVIIKLRPTMLEMTAYTEDGTVLDSITPITK